MSKEISAQPNTLPWWKRRTTRVAVSLALATAGMLTAGNEGEGDGEGVAAEQSCSMPEDQHPVPETNAEEAKKIGKRMITACFGADEWSAAKELWHNESSWNPMAGNPDSGACGIPQSWPCDKMVDAMLGPGHTLEDMTVEQQLMWGIDYIKDRYGTPTEALEFWKRAVPINGEDHGNWY